MSAIANTDARDPSDDLPTLAGGSDNGITNEHIRLAITVQTDMHRGIQRLRAEEGLLLWDARKAFLARHDCSTIEEYLDKMNVDVFSKHHVHMPPTWHWRKPKPMSV